MSAILRTKKLQLGNTLSGAALLDPESQLLIFLLLPSAAAFLPSTSIAAPEIPLSKCHPDYSHKVINPQQNSDITPFGGFI